MSQTQATWHCARVHYHETDKDPLILDGVRPLFQRLAESGITRAFFTRHWIRGPHLRINVHTDAETAESLLRPTIEETIGDYLRAHPSQARLDVEKELVSHRRLAELENERGDLSPWLPDNSIHFTPYDHRQHVLGSTEAAESLADFHVDTTALAFEALDEVRAGRGRLALPLDLMFVTAAVSCPPITKGFMSYRSHAEGFFANSGDPEGLRAAFDQRYEANRATLAERLAVLQESIGTSTALRHVNDWTALLNRYAARADALIDAGLIDLPSLAAFRDGAPDDGQSGPAFRISAFHEQLFADDAVLQELVEARWFAVYRVLLNYQYLFFNRLGLRPVDRFLLCHLAARTVEDVYDLPVKSLLQFVAQGRTHTSITL